MPDRMAGRAFALAADPSLLAADARHRGRLRHRGGAAEGFADFVLRLSPHGFVGANVTIPHKERALNCPCRTNEPARSAPPIRCGMPTASCARPTPTRRLHQQSRRLHARLGRNEDALVLGAGGASRAVVFGLIERGIKRVHLANRTIERAQALADQFGPMSSRCVGRDRRSAAARGTAGEHDVAGHARPARA